MRFFFLYQENYFFAVDIKRLYSSNNGKIIYKGRFEGLKGYAVGWMTKSRRGKLYIDDAGWGPEASSIECGYQVPFGEIHVFIGKIGEPGPEPDTCTDLVETAQCASPARVQPTMKRAFVGCVHGIGFEPVSEGETVAYSDSESSTGETESLYQIQDGVFEGYSDGTSIPEFLDTPNHVGIFMAGTLPTLQNSTVAASGPVAGAGGSARRRTLTRTGTTPCSPLPWTPAGWASAL